MAAMESGGAWGVAAITKFGWIKLLTLGAAGMGALLMAAFRPAKSRKEGFLQAFVALGSSLLFGSFIASTILFKFQLIDVTSLEDLLYYNAAIHGLVGAMSWGIFGGLATLRDKVGSDPVGTARDVKDLL